MKIHIELTQDRIPSDFGATDQWRGKAGALVEFSGMVRDEEKGQTIVGLDYEAYSAMALKTMHGILESMEKPYPCLEVRVMHRIGTIPVSEAAIAIAIWARHRTEAFGLLAAFMDRLKNEVPIWKHGPAGFHTQSMEPTPPGHVSNATPQKESA